MPATLDQLIRHNNLLRVFCDSCRRCETFEPADIAELYGRELQLPTLQKRLKCKVCPPPASIYAMARQAFQKGVSPTRFVEMIANLHSLRRLPPPLRDE